MRRLNSRARRAGDGERGAVAVIIALLVVALVGVAAYVIDIGAAFQERRELQVGADAAALAVAQDCASGDCGDFYATARSYADANATDGEADVLEGGITFPEPNLVRVETVTYDNRDNADGDTATVDYRFGGVFGVDGKTVTAVATAGWGALSGAATVPLTISLCEFQNVLGPGPYTDDTFDPAVPTTIYFHSGNNTPLDCAAQAGQDEDGDGRMPGGFGWLTSVQCIAELSVVDGAYWVASNPGNGVPNDCEMADYVGHDIVLPIFDDVVVKNDPEWDDQCGANKCYHVYGFAAFHLTGFNFSGHWTNPRPCNGDDRCIAGWFVALTSNAPGGVIGPGPDLGVRVVTLVS